MFLRNKLLFLLLLYPKLRAHAYATLNSFRNTNISLQELGVSVHLQAHEIYKTTDSPFSRATIIAEQYFLHVSVESVQQNDPKTLF